MEWIRYRAARRIEKSHLHSLHQKHKTTHMIIGNQIWLTLRVKKQRYISLRGSRSKGKGKGIRARDYARGRREEGNACKQAIVFAIPPTN